jgi:hypothetical protein
MHTHELLGRAGKASVPTLYDAQIDSHNVDVGRFAALQGWPCMHLLSSSANPMKQDELALSDVCL